MARSSTVYARVDPVVKERAEIVLSQLGISMATAMEIYLRQIAMQRKIPFEMALPDNMPIAYGALTDAQFDELMNESMRSYEAGECRPFEELEAELRKDKII